MRPASRGELAFGGPGLPREGAIPLVADLPTVELSDHPLLRELRAQTGPISRAALELAQALAPALPEEVLTAPRPEVPGLWEGFRYELARYSLAPALMNLALAQRALAESGAGRVSVRERPGGAWWLGGAAAGEAVREAVREAGVALRWTPGAELRGLRRRLAGALAQRAPRPIRHCWECEQLPSERLTAEPCDVLFLGVAATSAPFIAHLSQALGERGLRCAALDLHFDGSTEALRHTAVRVVDGRPSLYGGREAARQARARFPSWYRQTRAGLGELIQAGQVPRWLGSFLEVRLAVTLGRDLPQIAAFRRMAEEVLEALQPRLVAAFHLSRDFLAPFLLGAQARGAATACLQHGLRGPMHRSGVVLPWGNFPIFGPYTADLYEGLLPEGSRWQVTGNCLYDALLREGLPPPGPVRERLGLGAGPAVLVATQSDEPEVHAAQPRWWLRGVAEACQALGAPLLVKLHPVETDPALYEPLRAEFPEVVRVFPAAALDLREALAAAALLVTRDSTVVYEAALAGKPALTVNLPPGGPRLPLAEHGGAVGVSDYQEILPALRDLLENGPRAQRLAEQRPGFLAYHLGPQDGQATARTVEALLAAMERGG